MKREDIIEIAEEVLEIQGLPHHESVWASITGIDTLADRILSLDQKEQEGMSAEEYMFIWMDKKYGGSLDIEAWTPKDVVEFANDYAASRIAEGGKERST